MPPHPALTALARLPRKADGKVSITALDRLVREYGPDHDLAVMLWETGDAAARQLAVRGARAKHAIDDAVLIGFLPLIEAAAMDDRHRMGEVFGG